jgi:hypothetical protein
MDQRGQAAIKRGDQVDAAGYSALDAWFDKSTGESSFNKTLRYEALPPPNVE